MSDADDFVVDIDAIDPDWIKRGQWDIPAKNLDELLVFLDTLSISRAEFKSLEVYRAHVDDPGMRWLREL